MNILILSSVNPVDIIELGGLINKNINNKICETFSLQTVSLLAELSADKKYIPTMWAFAKTFQDKRKSILRLTQENLLCYGNLLVDTPIKFDHIICYEPDAANPVNAYLDESVNLYKQSKEPKIQNLAKQKWYTKEDADYTFTNLHHLLLFLESLKLTKETEEDATQSETRISDTGDRT